MAARPNAILVRGRWGGREARVRAGRCPERPDRACGCARKAGTGVGRTAANLKLAAALAANAIDRWARAARVHQPHGASAEALLARSSEPPAAVRPAGRWRTA